MGTRQLPFKGLLVEASYSKETIGLLQMPPTLYSLWLYWVGMSVWIISGQVKIQASQGCLFALRKTYEKLQEYSS